MEEVAVVEEPVVAEHPGRAASTPLRAAIRAISSGGAVPSRWTCNSALGTIRRPFCTLASADVMTRNVSLRELLAGVEGLALLRGLYDGTDSDAAQRLEELRRRARRLRRWARPRRPPSSTRQAATRSGRTRTTIPATRSSRSRRRPWLNCWRERRPATRSTPPAAPGATRGGSSRSATPCPAST